MSEIGECGIRTQIESAQRALANRLPRMIEQGDGVARFPDDIGDMPLHRQARLLHVPESREIRRLGATAAQSFNDLVDYPDRPSIFNSMVERETPQLDSVFHALGDATRRRMLRELASGERTVGQLAEPFAISLAAASKHIKALEKAGLIRREVRGRTHHCRLAPEPLAGAQQWLSFYERFWTDRLDALEQRLRKEDTSAPPTQEGDRK